MSNVPTAPPQLQGTPAQITVKHGPGGVMVQVSTPSLAAQFIIPEAHIGAVINALETERAKIPRVIVP